MAIRCFAGSVVSLAVFVFSVCHKPAVQGSDRIRAILTKGSGGWGPPGIDWGYAIYFSPASGTRYRFIGEGGYEVPMRYEIAGEQITIRIAPDALKAAGAKLADHLKPVTVCKLAELPDSLEYLYQLHCDNKLPLYSHDHPVIDQPRKVNGHAIITTGHYKAKALETVKFRKAPQGDAATISCTLVTGASTQDPKYVGDALPKGFSGIFVLGRTPEKVQVKNWKNYWLYVLVNTDPHDGESCQADHGWLFGEFVAPVK